MESISTNRNSEGAMAYLLWWVTGLVFLIIAKDKFVKFHAAQSVVVFGLLNAAMLVPVVGQAFRGLLMLTWIILWLVMMVKANNGQEWEVPVLGKMARRLV